MKKRNSKPEECFKRQIMDFLKAHKFFMFVAEAKAIKTVSNGRVFFRHSGVEPGISDLLGVAPCGTFVALELKAKGRRSTVSPKQVIFLERVIDNNGFGLVTDSIEHFTECYKNYKLYDDKKEYLLSLLPKTFK